MNRTDCADDARAVAMLRAGAASLLALTITLSGPGFACAQTPGAQVMSLAEALDRADRDYPTIKAALLDRTAASHRVAEAKTAYLPQVNLLLHVGTRNSERLDARFMTPFDAH